MRRINNYSINKESTEDMINAGRFNPCLQITFRDKTGKHTHKLSAGYGDSLDVYREGAETFVLSANSRLGYIGLEVFEGADKAGNIFIEEHQVKEVLGRDNLVTVVGSTAYVAEVKEVLGRDNLAPLTIIKRLKNYVYYH